VRARIVTYAFLSEPFHFLKIPLILPFGAREFALQLWMDLVDQASQGRIVLTNATFNLPQFIKENTKYEHRKGNEAGRLA